MAEAGYIYGNWGHEWNIDMVGGWPNDGFIPSANMTLYSGLNVFVDPAECVLDHVEETGAGAALLYDVIRNRFR